MTKFTPGQIYHRILNGAVEYAFIVGAHGDDAQVVLLPSGTFMTLDYDALTQGTLWHPPNADGWYIERVDANGTLRWGAFLPDFQTAWALFVAEKQNGEEEDGRIRVGGAADATVDELMTFDDASGYGPEPFIGLDAAIAAAVRADPGGPM